MSKDWDVFYCLMAEFVAKKSKDKSTQVGAVIVGPNKAPRTMGYNGFPRLVNDDKEHRHERPTKYFYTIHAETNAVLNALDAQTPIKGCTLYLSYHPDSVCANCMGNLIQAGIKEIVGPYNRPFPGKGPQWEESLKVAKEMRAEAGITTRVVYYHDKDKLDYAWF